MFQSRSKTLRSNKSGMDMIFVLTVFVLFVCCLLAAVLAFAKVYKRFGDDIEKRFNTATAQTLVLQKLRSYNSNAVSVGKQGETEYISFSDTIDGESYTTYIYAYGGQLRELFIDSSAPFTADNGNILFPADKFTAALDGNTVSFTIAGGGVQTLSHYCLRSGKDGAE